DPSDPYARQRALKPAELREFSPRAILCGLVVAAVMGASYPYIVLKLGFGPNVSVVAAFFGYLALGIVFKDYTSWENNIVQTAGDPRRGRPREASPSAALPRQR